MRDLIVSVEPKLNHRNERKEREEDAKNSTFFYTILCAPFALFVFSVVIQLSF